MTELGDFSTFKCKTCGYMAYSVRVSKETGKQLSNYYDSEGYVVPYEERFGCHVCGKNAVIVKVTTRNCNADGIRTLALSPYASGLPGYEESDPLPLYVEPKADRDEYFNSGSSGGDDAWFLAGLCLVLVGLLLYCCVFVFLGWWC